MAYTINQGYQNNHSLSGLQRVLLVGLPAIALILSLGAIIGGNESGQPAGGKAKLIPIVASLSTGASSSDKNGSGQNSKPSAGANGSAAAGNNSAAASTAGGGGTTAAAPSGSGGSTIIGGRGGGPTGGTSGGTGTSGGSTTLPDCSLNQIATVTCQVPECSPAVTLQPGQKAILGVGGTCVVIN